MLWKYDISDVNAKPETVMATLLPCSTYADFMAFALEQTARDLLPVVFLPLLCIHAAIVQECDEVEKYSHSSKCEY